jgi:hypothetical protein
MMNDIISADGIAKNVQTRTLSFGTSQLMAVAALPAHRGLPIIASSRSDSFQYLSNYLEKSIGPISPQIHPSQSACLRSLLKDRRQRGTPSPRRLWVPSPLAGEGVVRRATDEGSRSAIREPRRRIPTRRSPPHPTGFAGHLLPRGEKGARLFPPPPATFGG